MSGIKIVGNSSGTGTFTISSPNSNTSRTLTLPDETGTIITNATSGTVLQVVQASTSTEISISDGNETDTGLSASITPSSTSSKILVMVSHPTCQTGNENANNRIGMKLYRDSTEILYPINGIGYTATAVRDRAGCNFNYLDSPSTTSAVTYKTKAWNQAGVAAIILQINSSPSTIVLMEIAG